MSPVSMASQLVAGQRGELVGLEHADLGRAQGHHAGGGEAVRLVGADRSDLRGGQGTDFISGQGPMWSEFRPAGRPW